MKRSPSSNNVPTRALQVGFLCIAGVCFAVPLLGYFGPGVGDPSAWTDLVIGSDPHDGPEDMIEGTYEGGITGTHDDTTENNSQDGRNSMRGAWNIPTGGVPSPLYGAVSFSQQMFRFEEFGPAPIDSAHPPGLSFPAPPTSQGTPDGAALDAFLDQGLYPAPTVAANTTDQNPWKPEIEAYLGYPLPESPAEGRPPGEGWAHQRWDEFRPQVAFNTAQAGARTNNGMRDHRQLHGYQTGEFGPGGLYHNTAGIPATSGTTAGIDIRFHPAMPIQHPHTLWTWDGTFPPKLLNARYGESLIMRHYNALPIDIAANRGFGAHTISTHEHNGHNPAESDGYFNAFFFPGQFYDYRWPMLLAGHDSINTDATDPRAGRPDGSGGIINVPGDYRETMSTHWFHDHMQDFTAQNVYKGNVAMMNYYSSIDRGNEVVNDGINLRLPSGDKLDWGNRDYDVNLVMADKAWDDQGQLWYNPFQNDGMLGDHLLTNWLYHPYLDVRARRYRFRILNGSVARYYKFALVKKVDGKSGAMQGPYGSGVSYDRVPFHLIANDGNIMGHAIPMDGTSGLLAAELPVIGIAERFDIVVDFSQFAEGETLYFVNLLEHFGGRAPESPIPLESILSEDYKGVATDVDGDSIADRYDGGDPAVGRFLEFRVKAMLPGVQDNSIDLADYEPGGLMLARQPTFTAAELANARRREFQFGRTQSTDGTPWVVRTLDGDFNADARRITAAPNASDVEIWTIRNDTGGWSHPVHVHFEEGTILSRGGQTPPLWERFGRKDVYRVGPDEHAGQTVEFAIRFREFNGSYMEHCHNTTHEDTAMLLRWDIEFPGQVKLMPSPLPTWAGVKYVDSFSTAHSRSGDSVGAGMDPPPSAGGRGASTAVLAGNQPPRAMPDSGQVAGGRGVILNLLTNDSDPDGDLDLGGITIIGDPNAGIVEVLGAGRVRYTTRTTVAGLDSFSYTVSDQAGNVSNHATVSIQIQ